MGAPAPEALGQIGQVVRVDPKTGKRSLAPLVWGLLPHDAIDPVSHPRPRHARAETVAELPTFADAFRRRRCIMVANELEQRDTVGDTSGSYLIRRVDRQPMACAALWESYRFPDGTIDRSFCLVKCPASPLISPIRDRMTVILEPADWPVWLGEKDGDPQSVLRAPADGVLELIRPWGATVKP